MFAAWRELGLALACVALLGACSGEVNGGDGDDIAADAGPDSADADNADAAIEEPVARAVVRPTGGIGLNFRAGPSTDTEALEVLPDHAILIVRGEPEGVWWPLRYRDRDGYAHGDFLDVYLDGNVPPLAPGFNFLVPWADGVTFPVTQGHNTGSHVTTNSWAWDFGLPVGTPLHASHSGVVRSMRAGETVGGCDPAYVYNANYVTLDRGDGLETSYVHMDSVTVALGQYVERGELVGYSGATGYVCGAHLHFQVQLSPDGGGTTAGHNQAVHAYFWDTGQPFDPPLGTQLTSRNGSAAVP